MHPKDCTRGLSLSIWEKVTYQEDVLDVLKEHDKKYVFSTGGDFNREDKTLYPGVAIYHQGMDLVAVVATDVDVWQLRVRGQLVNETWSNIGIRWASFDSSASSRGGLELYVNAEKVGHSMKPELRPEPSGNATVGEWEPRPQLEPVYTDRTWRYIAMTPPIAMIGCHRTSDDPTFRDFSRANTAFDELAVWTRKLEVNRTHNEILYFTAGYDPQFQDLTLEKWTEMLDRVELNDPGQLQIAGLISSQFADQQKQLAAKILGGDDSVVVDFDDDSLNSGKIFPRTVEEQKDYDRIELDYTSAKKLLSLAGMRELEKPRYLVKRWTVLTTAAMPLEDTTDNIEGLFLAILRRRSGVLIRG